MRVHESVDEFRAIAEPLYRKDPVRNTVELTLLGANKFPNDSILLTVWDEDLPLGAALQDYTAQTGTKLDGHPITETP